MISFRFHVVSITAVFLAIAVGVVVGSTYVDRVAVDNLQRRIETVSNNLDMRKAENDALERSLEESRSYITASADFAVTERLAEDSVLIMATRGIDESAVADTVLLARQASGVVPGVLWIESSWALTDDGDRAAMVDLLDAVDGADPAQMWDEAWDAVAEELAAAPSSRDGAGASGAGTTTTAPTEDVEAQVLTGLVEAGFLTFDTVDDDSADLAALAGSGARVVLLTGADAVDEVVPLVPVVVEATADAGCVLAEVFVPVPDGPARGELLVDTIDQDTRDLIAVVDDADLVEGRVAAVLAVAGEPGVVVGHFGFGPDADAVLPAWSPL